MELVEEFHREFPKLTYDVTIKIEHLRKYEEHLPTLRDTLQGSPCPLGIMPHQQTPVAPMPPSWYSHDDLEFKPERSWTDDKEGIVRGPYNYVISHPGKDIRSQLMRL